MATKRLTFSGYLSLNSWGEADDILFISSEEDPLAEVLQDSISGENVSVRYWVTERECTRDEATVEFLKRLAGNADCLCVSTYSELTGYLWTDEEINIGGHDLLAELASSAGKWLILEIDVPEKN